MYVFKEMDGLVQERRNSIANAMGLRLSCTNPSKWPSAFSLLQALKDVAPTGFNAYCDNHAVTVMA